MASIDNDNGLLNTRYYGLFKYRFRTKFPFVKHGKTTMAMIQCVHLNQSNQSKITMGYTPEIRVKTAQGELLHGSWMSVEQFRYDSRQFSAKFNTRYKKSPGPALSLSNVK